MSKHTPGPWKASRFDAEDQTAVVLDDHPMPEGRRARSIQHIATVHGSTAEECFSNARLIASAPDLLAACKALIKSPDYVDVTIANGTKAKALMCWAHEWDQLHSAIAKAEGGQ